MIAKFILVSTLDLLAVSLTGSDDAIYAGVGSCRKCHLATVSGDQYEKWVESEHSNAYHILTTDDAKKIAKDKNLGDPTKAVECLKCHVTAYDQPAKKKGEKFDATLGIQCESCHGPGQRHVDERLDSDAGSDDKIVTLPKGELAPMPTAESCRKCHNKESPTYRPFAYNKFFPVMAHNDPRKKRPADYLEKLPADPADDPAAVAPKVHKK
ncbi:MAG TPA: cytochrome c family protein [Planctomycetota bacterium]|nr:cytochrome c family protein [Planctomycetota bacterium]